MRRDHVIRWGALIVLVLHALWQLMPAGESLWSDLIGYHVVALLIFATLFASPLHNDSLGIAFLACAFGCWIFGSFISSYGQFFSIPESTNIFASIAYALFYPFLLLAIPRILNKREKISLIEILDATIFGLGLSSIATALIFSKVIRVGSGQSFFEILYPVCDLIIVITIAIAALTQKINGRFLTLAAGALIYTGTDYFYLWQSLQGRYIFGSIFDNGWLIGLAIITVALWLPPAPAREFLPIHPAFIAISIFISPTLLAMMALRPGLFPSYIIAPTIATLFLAFIRMTVGLRQAHSLTDERVLARTDELTQLPNRRAFITELPEFSKTEGALMLLDLNGFKPVNDKYGHGAGDQVLAQVASRFSRALPAGTLLARLGGDEFGILLSGQSKTTLEIASALRACVSYPFQIDGLAISIGVSIGRVENSEGGDLLAKADAAMYEAKRSGDGIWHLASRT